MAVRRPHVQRDGPDLGDEYSHVCPGCNARFRTHAYLVRHRLVTCRATQAIGEDAPPERPKSPYVRH